MEKVPEIKLCKDRPKLAIPKDHEKPKIYPPWAMIPKWRRKQLPTTNTFAQYITRPKGTILSQCCTQRNEEQH